MGSFALWNAVFVFLAGTPPILVVNLHGEKS